MGDSRRQLQLRSTRRPKAGGLGRFSRKLTSETQATFIFVLGCRLMTAHSPHQWFLSPQAPEAPCFLPVLKDLSPCPKLPRLPVSSLGTGTVPQTLITWPAEESEFSGPRGRSQPKSASRRVEAHLGLPSMARSFRHSLHLPFPTGSDSF